MDAWQLQLPRGKVAQQRFLGDIIERMTTERQPNKTSTSGAPRRQGETTKEKTKLEWKCPDCSKTNWEARSTCRDCRAPRPSHATFYVPGREPRSEDRRPPLPRAPRPDAALEADRSPMRAKEKEKSRDKEDVDMEGSSEAADAVVNLHWQGMSMQQLKAELAKLEAMVRQAKESKLDALIEPLETNVLDLKAHIRLQLSEGQRLDSIQGELRRLTKQREFHQGKQEEYAKALRDTEEKLIGIAAEEEKLQKQLAEIKQAMAAETQVDTPDHSEKLKQAASVAAVDVVKQLPGTSETQVAAILEHALQGMTKQLCADVLQAASATSIQHMPPVPAAPAGEPLEPPATQPATAAALDNLGRHALPGDAYGACPKISTESGPYAKSAPSKPPGGAATN